MNQSLTNRMSVARNTEGIENAEGNGLGNAEGNGGIGNTGGNGPKRAGREMREGNGERRAHCMTISCSV